MRISYFLILLGVYLLPTVSFAYSSKLCRTFFGAEKGTASNAVSIRSSEGQVLLKSFGVDTKIGEDLAAFASQKNQRLFLRLRNPNALQYDNNSYYYPKESDVPFKSGKDGLVRASSKENFLEDQSNKAWAMQAWIKWDKSLRAGKYFVDENGLIHYGHEQGPVVYSDLDLFAVVAINENQSPQLIRFGNGYELKGSQERQRLGELNYALNHNQYYDLIRHGTQIEHQISLSGNGAEPLLEINEQGQLRVVDRQTVYHLLRNSQ